MTKATAKNVTAFLIRSVALLKNISFKCCTMKYTICGRSTVSTFQLASLILKSLTGETFNVQHAQMIISKFSKFCLVVSSFNE